MRESEKIREIGELTALLTSRAYMRVIDQRRERLQKEANRCIREQKWIEAFSFVARIDDLGKTLEMIQKELESIKKEK